MFGDRARFGVTRCCGLTLRAKASEAKLEQQAERQGSHRCGGPSHARCDVVRTQEAQSWESPPVQVVANLGSSSLRERVVRTGAGVGLRSAVSPAGPGMGTPDQPSVREKGNPVEDTFFLEPRIVPLSRFLMANQSRAGSELISSRLMERDSRRTVESC